jgi:hypothetical protein
MAGDGFQHPGLARAAEGLAKLRAAGAVLGSPDPVAALHHMDCAPAGVDALAAHVGDGADQLGTAHTQYGQGRTTALRSWSGQAADDFNQRSATTDTAYGNVRSATEDVHNAGLNIAAGLDGLANGTAQQALAIAANVDTAASIVLAGPQEPEYAQAALAVNSACLDVVNEVGAHVAQIPELERHLDGLGPDGEGTGQGDAGAAVRSARS